MADKEEEKRLSRDCHVCNVSCTSSLSLWEHVMGKKHRAAAERVSPEGPHQTRKFQYFLDTYLELEPLVGLEYIHELKKRHDYLYWCALCQVSCERNWLFVHITGPGHIATYAHKHHPEIALPLADSYSHKHLYHRAMQEVAVKIYRLHGRKSIFDNANPTPKKKAKRSSDPQTATPKRNPARNANGDKRQTAGFKGNADFLDYLQTFQIESDEDARIIREITQNCTQALLRYRQETPRGAPTPDNRTDKGSSVGNCGEVVPEWVGVVPEGVGGVPEGGGVVPEGVGGVPEGGGVVPAGAAASPDAMCQFFNSIKNMEEAEVVNMLQKIAATNPAFRGINVPSVIRHLQATGHLKTS